MAQNMYCVSRCPQHLNRLWVMPILALCFAVSLSVMRLHGRAEVAEAGTYVHAPRILGDFTLKAKVDKFEDDVQTDVIVNVVTPPTINIQSTPGVMSPAYHGNCSHEHGCRTNSGVIFSPHQSLGSFSSRARDCLRITLNARTVSTKQPPSYFENLHAPRRLCRLGWNRSLDSRIRTPDLIEKKLFSPTDVDPLGS